MRRRSTLLLAMLSITGAGVGCQKHAEKTQAEGPIVARVGSRTISSAEFQQKAMSQSAMVRASYTTLEKKKEFLNRLIRFELIMQESERVGMDKEEEVAEAIKQGMPNDKVRQKMANELVHDKFDKDPALKQIPEADVRAYYDAHQGDYVKPDRRRLEIIFLKGKEGDRKVSDEAKRLLADLQEKQAKGNGGAFATTARVRSDDDATKPRGGDAGLRSQEDLANAYGPAVAQAAMALKAPNDMSGVVRGNGGWYLIKLMARQDAMNETFEQAAPMIEGRLRAEKFSTLVDSWVKDLRAKANVVIYDDELNKIDLQGTPTGSAAVTAPPGAPAATP